jgi:replicative DNA helicase
MEELTKQGLLEEVGGYSGVIECMNAVVTATNIKQHAVIVKDKSLRRKLIIAQDKNQQIILDESKDIDTVLSEAQSNIIKINNFSQIDDGVSSIINDLERVQDEYVDKYKKGQKYLGVSCGIEKIDQSIDGLRPGHIWVVGAWTSTGKSQFVLNIVNSVLEQKVPVSIISLEMSRVDTLARLIGIKKKISSMAVLKGKNDLQIQYEIEEAKDFFKNAPLQIHTTYFDLEKIKMLIRTDVYTKKVKFVVVDYVQNIISEKGSRGYDLMTQAATDLQSLARELGVTIYLVSQISNESEKGNSAGAGFKGTGALEAVADLAIKLERDRKKEGPMDQYVPLKIKIVKNRHGFTGIIDNYFLWLKSGKIEADLKYT